MRKKTDPSSSLDNVAFVKARYEYCFQLYKNEQERKEILEKKAQFYLSLITLFFGALILKLDFITEINNVLNNSLERLTLILYFAISVFFTSLVFALIAILISIQVRGYLIEHPADLTSSLFNSTSEYLAAQTDIQLYTSTAQSYALATESDRSVNAHKSRWVRLGSLSILIAFLSFIVVYAIVAFLILS